MIVMVLMMTTVSFVASVGVSNGERNAEGADIGREPEKCSKHIRNLSRK